MTLFFPIRGLSFLLRPAISFLSARCASRGKTLVFHPRHLGHDGKRLVRRAVSVGGDLDALRLEFGTCTYGEELLRERLLARLLLHDDRCQEVRPIWRVMLKRELTGVLEVDVDNHALGG